MVRKNFIRGIICCGFIIIIHMMPKATARKRDVEEFMIGEQQRTRKKHNYVEQLAPENEIFVNTEDMGPLYETKSAEGNKETLPAFIVDYANMIRNDVILLDNSVETRTRKRGNIKVEKHNQVIPDIPCNCESSKQYIDLGVNCYPRYIENRNCSNDACRHPYKCKPNIYELTILERGVSTREDTLDDIPPDLKRRRWTAFKQPVTIGCTCSKDYIVEN